MAKTNTKRLMNQVMEDQQVCICQKCKTVYQINLLKPGEDYNDFGTRFCHYCGDFTQSFPDWVKVRTQNPGNNIFVFITISGGLIDQVKFYKEPISAINTLSDFVRAMDPENDDACVYDRNEMIANAKDFLDEKDYFSENPEVFEKI